MTGVVFNIQRFSVNDGPGIRTTVFLKGCPLRCRWCHNPESLSTSAEVSLQPERCILCGECYSVCKHHAILKVDGSYITLRDKCLRCGECTDACVSEARLLLGKTMTTEEVVSEIKKDRVFYIQSHGGATFSGGEPLMQHEFLLTLLRECRREQIPTAVDTSGYASPYILRNIADETDLFLYDLKTLNDDVHRRTTGVSNRRILENLCLLAEWKKPVIVRVPVIPGVNDNDESINAIGTFVRRLGTIGEMHLLPYHQSGVEKYRRLGLSYSMGSLTPPPPDRIALLAENLRRSIPTVAIGG